MYSIKKRLNASLMTMKENPGLTATFGVLFVVTAVVGAVYQLRWDRNLKSL